MAHTFSCGSGSSTPSGRDSLCPILSPLPTCLLIGAFISDVAFVSTRDAFWAVASYWLLIGGVGAGVVAALPGVVHLLCIETAGRLPSAWIRGLGNVLAVLIAFSNLSLRWDHESVSIVWTGLMLSALVVAILLATRWLGGELSYKHDATASNNMGKTPPDDAPV